MNIETQDIDPRESLATETYDSVLTDNESEDDEIRKQMALLDKQRKELELQLQRKQISKAQHDVDATRPGYFQDLPPISKTGNSIVDKLAASKRAQQMKEQRVLQLQKSRVYTFDDSETDHKIIHCNEIDKYSGKRLVQRYISATRLDQYLGDKKILRLDKVFAKIAPPDFQEPDYFNWCVIGVITKKSEPMFTTSKKSSKFMKITLSDYRLQLDLTLFDQAFHKYWKLKIGDLIAVLNPQVWVNRNKKFSTNINAFNITLKYDHNSILEIGKADIRYCHAITKSGTSCSNVIPSTDTYCYYHQEIAFKKTTAKRMELNGSFKMYDPVNNGVRQQVLYSSTSTQKDNNNNGAMFNDPLAEKRDRYSQLSKGFTSSEAAKAFFNDDLADVKAIYKERQNNKSQNVSERKRRFNDEKEIKMTSNERKLAMKQRLKASIIKDEFTKPIHTANDDDDDNLDIIF